MTDNLQSLFVKRTYIKFGDYPELAFLKTGLISLDRALGGGLPIGRITEIYGGPDAGKSSLCFALLRAAQEQNWVGLYVDMERKALSNNTRQRFQLSDFFYAKPPTAEEAIETLIEFFQSGEQRIAFLDSLESLVPSDILSKNIDESTGVAYLSRFINHAKRLLIPIIDDCQSILVFTNQIRSSIGSQAGGCLPGHVKVMLADGSKRPIEQIVQEKLPLEVLSYDSNTNQIVKKPIINWFVNGRSDQWLAVDLCQTAGRLLATPDHQIPTVNRGVIPVAHLQAGDQLISTYSSLTATPDGHGLINGLLLSGLFYLEQTIGTARLCYTASSVKPEFNAWIDELLEIPLELRTNVHERRTLRRSRQDLEMAFLRDCFYKKDASKLTRCIPKHLTLTDQMACSWLVANVSKLNYEPNPDGLFIDLSYLFVQRRARDDVYQAHRLWVDFIQCSDEEIEILPKQEGLLIKPDAYKGLLKKIKPWVPSFAQSILYQDQIIPKNWSIVAKFVSRQVLVEKVYPVNLGKQTMYDLEVADTHNYFAGTRYTVNVHNSSSTPGGYGARHMGTIRLQLTKKENISKENLLIGQVTQVKVQKNHASGSVRQSIELNIYKNEGIDPNDVMAYELLYVGLVVRSGSWFKFSEEAVSKFGVEAKIGQGMSSVVKYLKSNPELFEKLYEYLYKLPL